MTIHFRNSKRACNVKWKRHSPVENDVSLVILHLPLAVIAIADLTTNHNQLITFMFILKSNSTDKIIIIDCKSPGHLIIVTKCIFFAFILILLIMYGLVTHGHGISDSWKLQHILTCSPFYMGNFWYLSLICIIIFI